MSPRDIAYLPQTADIDRSFPISVYDFVASGCGAPRRSALRRTERAQIAGRSPPSADRLQGAIALVRRPDAAHAFARVLLQMRR